MLRLRVLDDARREYAEAVRWYLDDDLDVARDMVAEYIARVRFARRFPNTGTPVPAVGADFEVRRHLLKRFPYAVYIARLHDELVIVAVAHTHRRPGYWQNRLAKIRP
jgi:plasmid stabilization system protein ParE